MSIRKKNSNIEYKINKNVMPIAINTNANPNNNYLFVNKKNQIASLYLKMGQKMKSNKLKNTKSCSNLQNSDDSSKNNSFQLPNLSMLKNLKTNNISGNITNRSQNKEQKNIDKQDYIIHVNKNKNHKSSLLNILLNNKKKEKENSVNKYSTKINKNDTSLNNSEFNNSIYCLSTRNKLNHNAKEDKLDLKKIKNNMKTQKFKIQFYGRRKNKYMSTSFCNIKNDNRTRQKSDNKIISKNLSYNRIYNDSSNSSIINYKDKKIQHSRFNTMIIDEKNINCMIKRKNKSKTLKQTSTIKYNNSVCSIENKQTKDSLLSTKNNNDTNKNINHHIKNTFSMNGNRIIYDNNLITKDKKINKKIISNKDKNNKNIKNNNPIIDRKVKICRKDLLQEIKSKINTKKTKEIKNNKKKEKQNEKNKKGKIKEFSKIIVLGNSKHKKTSIDFHNDKYNSINKNSTLENVSKTKRDLISKNNSIISNSKSKENIKIEKIKTLDQKSIRNNGFINNNSLQQRIINDINIDNNNVKDSNNIIEYTNRFNVTCFPFPLMTKKTNYKKPLIKITAKSNISFNKNDYDKDLNNTSIANNSEIMSINQNNLLFQDKSLIIRKKKSISNNSFHINKKLICHSSRVTNKSNNNIKEIKNRLFDYDNLEKFPENYDEKFDDLYSVVHRINFGAVLIGAESLFCLESNKYKEFQCNFDSLFIKQYNKLSIEENKGKYIKKINNSCSTKTDFSSSNKNFYKNIYQNNSIAPNEFEISEYI